MRNIFGWSLPPGVSKLPGEEPEGPCAVCCRPVDECVCPSCRVCGEHGNRHCYEDKKAKGSRGNAGRHGQRLNGEQLTARLTVYVDRLKAKADEEERELHRLMNKMEAGKDPFASAVDGAGEAFEPYLDGPFSDRLEHQPDPWTIRLTWE